MAKFKYLGPDSNLAGVGFTRTNDVVTLDAKATTYVLQNSPEEFEPISEEDAKKLEEAQAKRKHEEAIEERKKRLDAEAKAAKKAEAARKGGSGGPLTGSAPDLT
jgi:predicted nucleotidyltransferase